MADKAAGAASTTERLSLTEAIRAMDWFLNCGLSPQESLEAARSPEAGLSHDGETWSNRPQAISG